MKLLHILIAFSCVLLSACSGSRLGMVRTDIQPHQLAERSAFQVMLFDASAAVFSGDYTDIPERVAEERALIPTMIQSELTRLLLREGFAVGTEADALVIEGEVFKVNHGSSAARMWVGSGAGAASIQASVRIKRGDEVLADFDIAGTSGGQGGLSSMSSWVEQNAEDLASGIAEYLTDKVN